MAVSDMQAIFVLQLAMHDPMSGHDLGQSDLQAIDILCALSTFGRGQREALGISFLALWKGWEKGTMDTIQYTLTHGQLHGPHGTGSYRYCTLTCLALTRG